MKYLIKGDRVSAVGRLYDRAVPTLLSVQDGDEGEVNECYLQRLEGQDLDYSVLALVCFPTDRGMAFVVCSVNRLRVLS